MDQFSSKRAAARDPSTLSSLVPAQPREVSYRSFRASARMQGSHLMLLRRPSRVAEAAREYVGGDPVHLIDWKAYARTDQLIIREKRDEATARVLIGLDISATMQWPGQHLEATRLPSVPPTKADIATRVAMHVAHTHLKRGDMVELRIVPAHGGKASGFLRAKPRSPSDVVALFYQLEKHGFSPEAYEAAFHKIPTLEQGRPRSTDVAIWVGDGLGEADVLGFLELGKRKVLLHVLSSLELDVSWLTNDIAYFDDGANGMGGALGHQKDHHKEHLKEYQGQVLRQEDHYLQGIKIWREKFAERLKSRGGAYVELNDKTAIAAYERSLQALGLLTSN